MTVVSELTFSLPFPTNKTCRRTPMTHGARGGAHLKSQRRNTP